MYLDGDGTLSPSTGTPFTHILKPAGTSGYEGLPIAEWLAMALGEAAGFAVPVTVLVAMPAGMPPALVVERFDIRESLEDRRMLALEDLCSVLDLSQSTARAWSKSPARSGRYRRRRKKTFSSSSSAPCSPG